MPIIEREALLGLSMWGRSAFAARCARRFLALHEASINEPADQRLAVSQAVRLAELRAEIGGERRQDIVLEINGQLFDHYDISSVEHSLIGASIAASNTFDEIGHGITETGHILMAVSLAKLAFEISLSDLFNQSFPSNEGDLLEQTIYWVEFSKQFGEEDFERIRAAVDRDLEAVKRGLAENREEHSGFSAENFGPLWVDKLPDWWPARELSFRPRARLIRTIGDRLISGPEAAVIELIKNSHDADASFAKITFVPPFSGKDGYILIEDDGHGMTLEDVEQKWMEPATSDKRDRKFSRNGRQLLGSKGIGRFAASRLGKILELRTVAELDFDHPNENRVFQETRIPRIDWNAFEDVKYLDDVRFPVESILTDAHPGTMLKISSLRDDWSELGIRILYEELRKLISPVPSENQGAFRILLDLSRCLPENCGFNGRSIFSNNNGVSSESKDYEQYEVRPFPILEASDYAIDGIFDENGEFSGTMTIRRGGLEPEVIGLKVPLSSDLEEQPCGVVLIKLHIFDREAEAIRSTAEKAGFGRIGVREARRLLDNVCGVGIYRSGFRIRPYGDSENDWLTLDAKRVQNPSLKIGRNQIAGIVIVDSEEDSNLIERSSREGLEENGSFRRLRSLASALLAEVIEPRRRQFRIAAGIDAKPEVSFRDVYDRVKLGWSKILVAKIPEADRAEAEALISQETDRLTLYLKRLEDRQAKLEAQVTLGLIIGEVMHQGNTPLAFLETESARLTRWWPHLFDDSEAAQEDREQVPIILNGLSASSGKLRELFNSLSPLSGARRGAPAPYNVLEVIQEVAYLFQSRLDRLGIKISTIQDIGAARVIGYRDDLATAFTNLIDNSIHWLSYHSVLSPTISVAISTQDNRCQIAFGDNGVGIPDEFKDQLFDVGFTLKANGTGLGLSIAREAIYRSGGDLRVAHENEDALFFITLPFE